MAAPTIPNFTKLFHQMAFTDSKYKELYAQTIIRLESLKKKDKDPIALAHAYQISFIRIEAEFKEKLDILEEYCTNAKLMLTKLERLLRPASNASSTSSSASSTSSSSNSTSSSSSSTSSSAVSSDTLANKFNEYIDDMGEHIDLIQHIIGRFNTVQQFIIKDQIKIDDIQEKYATLTIQLYESKGEIETELDEYKMAMESLCADISTSQENLPKLANKLFPVPKKEKKKKAT